MDLVGADANGVRLAARKNEPLFEAAESQSQRPALELELEPELGTELEIVSVSVSAGGGGEAKEWGGQRVGARLRVRVEALGRNRIIS